MNSLLVLCYHSISDDVTAPIIGKFTVSPSVFKHQLEYFEKRKYHFISPTDFYDFVAKKKELTSKSILLTFDDCYEDLLTHAYPILKEKNIKPICFAITGLLGQYNKWDIENGARKIKLISQHQLLCLENEGFAIGSHTRTHQNLAYTSENLYVEVDATIKDFNEMGLKNTSLFAYPFGLYNKQVQKRLEQAGFIAAFTIDRGLVFDNSPVYLLPRIMLNNKDTSWRLAIKISIYRAFYKLKYYFNRKNKNAN